MDERKVRMKALKKARNRAKRKHVTLWKTLGILFLILAILLSAGFLLLQFLGSATILELIADSVIGQLPYVQQMIAFLAQQTIPFLAAVAAAWVLFIVFLGLWVAGNRRYKKSAGYLDYMTMKRTVKAMK